MALALSAAPLFAEGAGLLDEALRKWIDRLASGEELALAIHDCFGVRHYEASYAQVDQVCELPDLEAEEESEGSRGLRIVLEAKRQPNRLHVTLSVERQRDPNTFRIPLLEASLGLGDSLLVSDAIALGLEPFEIAAVPMRPTQPPLVGVRNVHPEVRVEVIEQTWHRVFVRLINESSRAIQRVHLYQTPQPAGMGGGRSALGNANGRVLAPAGEDVLYVIGMDYRRADGRESLMDKMLVVTGIEFRED